ncbi:hypothetical protein FOXG_11458 [Fusarium oxysporum f. sp. lycopersici 4287]|uniref:Glycine-rich domain-containing protein 1 n=3 Tax=Fusarium oxysporum TaxID=5507 RepID=A0A0J9VK83_FUSO4|nr:hypothetical protein FOXG_11458 [Fusarium oxysporum f. sp. lycopersici 4287]EXK30190.1 hypothetical protein FOMG_13816 [Fusarium oxysporum f. sp. melonis 26406]KAJ9418510.1 hypothetical protein QL093DRAFT_2386268 [Fusarium oxysporum]KNB11624.1 hypothetical protein FOXG_11458 [Fusarium oxysporum f. sp. lycopersici 4287]
MSHLIGYNTGALHQASSDFNNNISKTYYPSATDLDENPVIPSPDIFSELDDSHKDNLPTPVQCAVHLELLEAFHALRIKILDSKKLDKAFNLGGPTKKIYRRKYIKGLKKHVNEEVTLRNPSWEAKRDKKWTWYLGEAAQRFLVWAAKFNAWLTSTVGKDGAHDGKTGISMTDTSWLPPVDILMIWHAFLLNPSDYLDYCRNQYWDYLPRVNFPWKLIHDSIRSQGPIRDAWVVTGETWEVPEGEAVIPGTLLKSIIQRGNMQTQDIGKPYASRFIGKLVDNVERQRVFVEKMNAHLWIRSPALQGSLRRAVERYERYLRLFKLYPGKMLVPALDIDLVWHTSQLSATAYMNSMEARCGRFINHDDKIKKSKLAAGNDETQSLYRIRFGEEYTVCLCWECQAIMSAVEDSADGDEFLGESPTSGFAETLADKILADVQFYRAVESARRRNHVKLPIRPEGKTHSQNWPFVAQ